MHNEAKSCMKLNLNFKFPYVLILDLRNTILKISFIKDTFKFKIKTNLQKKKKCNKISSEEKFKCDFTENSTLHCNPVQGGIGVRREIPVMKTGSLQ